VIERRNAATLLLIGTVAMALYACYLLFDPSSCFRTDSYLIARSRSHLPM
jgi:hypothetical protein